MKKLYLEIKTILKENYKFFIGLIIAFAILTFELPFYIDAPGGLIDISKRIEISDSYDIKGSFNLAYVSEFKATIPTLIWALVDKDWDILNNDDVVSSNETVDLIDYRNHLLLEEANENAIYVGFNLANEEVNINNRKEYVVYVDQLSNSDLQIGDQIIKINGIIVNNKQDIYNILGSFSLNQEIAFTVINNEVEYTRTGKLYSNNGKNIIGIVLSETKDVETLKNIKFNFKTSESGPSGGFMMALSIYDLLTNEDLTHGLTIVGTGTIDESGNVGTIGGIEYKIKGAVKKHADIFFVPAGENYEEADKLIKEENLDITLIKVSNIEEAIEYLNSL